MDQRRRGSASSPRPFGAEELVIDCDVHNHPPSMESLFPFMDGHWQEVLRETGFRLGAVLSNTYPIGAPTSMDPSIGANGNAVPTAGSVRTHLFDGRRIDLAILNCYSGVDALRNPDLAGALSSAINDWQVSEWLDEDPRFRASIVVSPHDPHEAAKEIDRLGGHPGFVQVLLPVRTQIPYGNRRYTPIFETAQRHDLVIGIHFGGTPGTPPTQSGWPTYYLEEYVGMAQVCQSQVISLIAEGVFERFPRLKIALLECGFSWVPSLIWRLDKDWKGLRREIPWVKRLPSEYLREHFRASLQPVDAPRDPQLMLELIEQIGSDDFLMFSTDHPHAHSTEATESFLEGLPGTLREAVLGYNAKAFYGI